MGEDNSTQRLSVLQLILIPSVITLAVTLFRLAGELRHGSKVWFNPDAGGPWSIVGITWLAPLFGIYFALKLAAAEERPRSFGRAVGLALLAVAFVYGMGYVGFRLHVQSSFQGRLVFFWVVFVLAALITLPGWPALFKVLLAYAFAARVPVALVMLFAFRGNWHTHYDALPPDMPAGMGVGMKYVWLGLVPQLTFWVGFTIVSGLLFGSVVAAVAGKLRRAAPAG